MSVETRSGLSAFRFIVRPRPGRNPRSAGLLEDAHALGLVGIRSLEYQDLYFIEGRMSEVDLQRIAHELLSDPITQIVEWGRLFSSLQPATPEHLFIDVALRPGVTDPVAEQIVRAAGELGISGVERACTGQRYEISGEGLQQDTLPLLARRLLSNPVIQRYALGEIEPVFPLPAEALAQTETIPVRGLEAASLSEISLQRRAALDLAEMRAIQAYFQSEGRDPTDIEFEMIAQTWSEHCVHKTFKALVHIQEAGIKTRTVDGLLNTYIRNATDQIAAPWVRSAFKDNAGILDFDDENEVSFKVETHNHPSAIEPFGGANTGVGGVIRDILGVSAKPLAATDVLCFGPQDLAFTDPDGKPNLPEGVLHPRRIQSGVVAGVQDYGNKIGIPTVNGAILYDPGYTANPLVFCGCVGIAPKNSHPRQPQAGDRIIVLGGRTGRDGLRGATFSSMTMDAQTGEVSGASVQIGDPITEKGLIEVLIRARDLRLYTAVTDCGAGGLSSAVGEMASECGARVELKQVRLKYPGLAPWEIWLSEAQERMVFAVPVKFRANLQSICDTFDVALTDIGEFNSSGRLVVCYDGLPVLDLSNDFLHGGIPQRVLKAEIVPHPWGLPEKKGEATLESYRWHQWTASHLPVADIRSESGLFGQPLESSLPPPGEGPGMGEDLNQTLLHLLSDPNIASKEAVIRIYDHEVQGGTYVKPLTGVQNDGPSDACVLKPIGAHGKQGIVLSNGINPEFGKRDAYRMAVSVVDEAVRNAVAVGADPQRLALLDNFCWGDPLNPHTLGTLVEAARGCYEAALHYRTPFISGKDSLNNEYLGTDGKRHAIPPTLLISAIGVIEDAGCTVTMDLKEPGNVLYRLGELPVENQAVPNLPAWAPALYQALHQAIRAGLVRACHDLSEGGLAVAAAEMCIGGRLGLELSVPVQEPRLALFGEVNGSLLIEVRPSDLASFEALLDGLPMCKIGSVTAQPHLSILSAQGQKMISLSMPELVSAWKRFS